MEEDPTIWPYLSARPTYMGFSAPPDLTPLCASEDLLEVMLEEFAEVLVP